jgi:hypothetical protein
MAKGRNPHTNTFLTELKNNITEGVAMSSFKKDTHNYAKTWVAKVNYIQRMQ